MCVECPTGGLVCLVGGLICLAGGLILFMAIIISIGYRLWPVHVSMQCAGRLKGFARVAGQSIKQSRSALIIGVTGRETN